MASLSAEELREIKLKVREELPIPEDRRKRCPESLSKLYALRGLKEREYIDKKKMEMAETKKKNYVHP